MAARVPPAWVIRPMFALRNGLARVHRGMLPPEVSMVERSLGIVDTKALAVVAELGVADALADGPLPIDELAAAVGAEPDALGRVIRYLMGRGTFRRSRDGRLANTKQSELLCSDRDDSLRDWVRLAGAPWHVEIWNELGHATRTGDSGASKAFGRDFWEYTTKDEPEAGRLFDAAMAALSRVQQEIVATKYAWPTPGRLCDVGGGTGTLLAAILDANPGLDGVLFDLPEVTAKARPVLEAAGVADRVEVVGGDFFTAVPEGCDRYLLQAIVHDWDDESCVRFLSRCREALPEGGRVLVLEQTLPDHDGDAMSLALDLEMLVVTGKGRERTKAQFAELFERAGLRVRTIVPIAVITLFELEPIPPS